MWNFDHPLLSTTQTSSLSLPASKPSIDYFGGPEEEDDEEVDESQHPCADTDRVNRLQIRSPATQAKALKIRICWFEEFSRLVGAEQVQTLTYLEDF